MSTDKYTTDQIKRFYAKISILPTETGCLDWTGSISHGYGRLTINRKQVYAHRFAWELVNGPVPEGLIVCHHCDNPRCVNVDHLFLGTVADNAHDMLNKGRNNNGGWAKLTKTDVLEIRSDKYADWPLNKIAAHFGVTSSHIHAILNRETWKHLGGDKDAPVQNRQPIGVRNKSAKLTDADVLEIRSGRFGGWSQARIARHFGVSESRVCDILRRKAWTHI